MSKRSPITCHVLDVMKGRPAAGIPVGLFQIEESPAAATHRLLATGATDGDGRCNDLLDAKKKTPPGLYKMTFHTGKYLEDATGKPAFYPFVEITFRLGASDEHYHIPLLLSPYSYTTYRGS